MRVYSFLQLSSWIEKRGDFRFEPVTLNWLSERGFSTCLMSSPLWKCWNTHCMIVSGTLVNVYLLPQRHLSIADIRSFSLAKVFSPRQAVHLQRLTLINCYPLPFYNNGHHVTLLNYFQAINRALWDSRRRIQSADITVHLFIRH